MSRRTKRKLNRAYSVLTSPAGTTMYVPPGQLQGVLGQVFYGSKAGIPVQQATMFSPGTPLPPQPGVDPGGKPVQFKFPIAVNTFPVDRTLGQPDIPGFEQLRRLARLYSGIGLCERYWMDLVPRMTLNITLKKMYKDQGAEEKDYQQQIKFFKNFFAKPDGRMDLHSWIRKALKETGQIDELYVYKHRTRGGKLLGLWIVDGAQMKPLMDDWGMQPEAPAYAYQQYPWGLPGMLYSSRQMIHYQESPATDSPYGFSRVERVIMEVNQALRKKKKDLANFTEGNIPQSFMEVPESPNWTPDQIDAYSQSFNALLAGNVQQQVRMLFLQPGMKYIPAEQYQMLTDFDMFLFKVSCGCYGVPPTEFGFTEDSNRSSGESQEDMVYRRTIEPIALMYASILTSCMAEDFPDELDGDMFEASFGGYEEVEDEGVKATANTTYTGAGVLGLTDAAKLGNLPIDPTAKPVGRILTTPNGPLFLDDAEFMEAWRTSAIAGFKMAANPPEPTTEQQHSNNKGEKTNGPSGNSPRDTPGSSTSNAGAAPRGTGASGSASRPATGNTAVRNERALYADRDGRDTHRVQDSETRDGIYPAEFAHPDNRETGGEQSVQSEQWTDENWALDRHLPGKHDQKEHGIWASHKHGGTHMQKFADSLQKKAASYSAMADRKLSARWTAQDARIASNIAHDLRHIASVISANPHTDITAMLKQMLAEAQKLHDMAPHAMSAHRLEVLQHTIEQYQHASAGGSHTAHSSHTGHGHHAHRAVGMEDDVESWAQQNAETEETVDRAVGDEAGRDASGAAQQNVVSHATAGLYPDQGQSDDARADYKRWRTRAIEDAKAGKQQRGFTSVAIPASIHGYISQLLHACTSADEVRAVFSRAQAQESEIAGSDQMLVYNAQLDIWEPEDTEQQLEHMRAEGTQYLEWETHASISGVCPVCDQNVGQVVRVGERFKSGHRLPSCHIGCQCGVKRYAGKPQR